MKVWKKISIFVILTLVFCMALSVVAFAADGGNADTDSSKVVKLDKDMSGENMTLGERFGYAMQGTATGMLMVFSVLGLLWAIVALSKVVLYDMPRKKAEKQEKERQAAIANKAENAAEPVAVSEPVIAAEPATDDGELVAVITAAIAAMIESGEYNNEFVGGFRVVSFKRSANSAWNRK